MRFRSILCCRCGYNRCFSSVLNRCFCRRCVRRCRSWLFGNRTSACRRLRRRSRRSFGSSAGRFLRRGSACNRLRSGRRFRCNFYRTRFRFRNGSRINGCRINRLGFCRCRLYCRSFRSLSGRRCRYSCRCYSACCGYFCRLRLAEIVNGKRYPQC